VFSIRRKQPVVCLVSTLRADVDSIHVASSSPRFSAGVPANVTACQTRRSGFERSAVTLSGARCSLRLRKSRIFSCVVWAKDEEDRKKDQKKAGLRNMPGL
jgi:hypothetical protein